MLKVSQKCLLHGFTWVTRLQNAKIDFLEILVLRYRSILRFSFQTCIATSNFFWCIQLWLNIISKMSLNYLSYESKTSKISPGLGIFACDLYFTLFLANSVHIWYMISPIVGKCRLFLYNFSPLTKRPFVSLALMTSFSDFATRNLPTWSSSTSKPIWRMRRRRRLGLSLKTNVTRRLSFGLFTRTLGDYNNLLIEVEVANLTFSRTTEFDCFAYVQFLKMYVIKYHVSGFLDVMCP
jgi:hypothetical protein